MSRVHVRILVLLGSIGLHVAGIVWLTGDGSWVEAIYARRVYPVIGPVVAFGPARVPFSVAGVLIIVFVLVAAAWLVANVVRWRRGRVSLRAVITRLVLACSIVGAVGFHAFYLFWGYNYLRPALEQRLAIDYGGISAGDRAAFALEFVAVTNAARVEVGPWQAAELDLLIDAAVAGAVETLEARPPPVVSPLKGDFGTGFFARQGFRGGLNPFTLEPHVDFGLPPFVLPFTAAHEKAHQAGFARERDANFVAWLALTRAEDARLRYAGLFGVLSAFLDSDSRVRLSAEVRRDRRTATEYQASLVLPPVRDASRRVYTSYLRANRMPAGMGDYAEVWQLIQAWERRGL